MDLERPFGCVNLLGALPNVAPVTLKVANLVTNRGQNWELLTAAAFVSMLLPLAVFFTLQNTEIVTLKFFFWQFSLSRALMFFLLLGVIHYRKRYLVNPR